MIHTNNENRVTIIVNGETVKKDRNERIETILEENEGYRLVEVKIVHDDGGKFIGYLIVDSEGSSHIKIEPREFNDKIGSSIYWDTRVLLQKGEVSEDYLNALNLIIELAKYFSGDITAKHNTVELVRRYDAPGSVQSVILRLNDFDISKQMKNLKHTSFVRIECGAFVYWGHVPFEGDEEKVMAPTGITSNWNFVDLARHLIQKFGKKNTGVAALELLCAATKGLPVPSGHGRYMEMLSSAGYSK